MKPDGLCPTLCKSMSTRINISRKLESVIPKSLIKKEYIGLTNPLGKWTASLFYVSRKKCLLITNSNAKYSIIIDRITKVSLENFSNVFTNTLYEQLLTDEIEIDLMTVQSLVGEVELFETDNDKQLIGTQNSIRLYLEDWKHKFGHIENWPFREINKRINRIPYKQLDWLFPREKMRLELNKLSATVG